MGSSSSLVSRPGTIEHPVPLCLGRLFSKTAQSRSSGESIPAFLFQSRMALAFPAAGLICLGAASQRLIQAITNVTAAVINAGV